MFPVIKELFIFAIPIILGQLGQMLLGVGEILVAGHYATTTQAAIGIAVGLTAPFFMFGIGMTFVIGPLTSKKKAENNLGKDFFYNAFFISFFVSILISLGLYGLTFFLDKFSFVAELVPEAKIYLELTALSMIPMVCSSTIKEYLQGLEDTFFANASILVVNIFNVVCTYILMFGKFGFPEMGVKGAAIAMSLSRLIYFISLLVYFHYKHTLHVKFKFLKDDIKTILEQGLPVSCTVLLEVLFFSSTTILCGKMSIIAAASHNFVFNIVALTFMIPLAIASAVSIKVGHEHGLHSKAGIFKYAKASLLLATMVMCVTAFCYSMFPEYIMRIGVTDVSVINYGKKLFIIAAIFQFPDALQVTLSGILRALGITKVPMLINLCSNWFIGLPIGYYLAFNLKYEALGLWIGLAIGLYLMAISLSLVLKHQLKSYQ
jgi:MATE family multidrug resistance protein